MRRCVICRLDDIPADDVAFVGVENPDLCICLRCWNREIGETIYMPRTLRLDVADAAGKE